MYPGHCFCHCHCGSTGAASTLSYRSVAIEFGDSSSIATLTPTATVALRSRRNTRQKRRSSVPNVLPILTDGDPRLHVRAMEVEQVDTSVRCTIDDLVATLLDFRACAGFGRAIAAPQVGISRRIIAIHLGARPFALINPEITWRTADRFDVWDDCLSVPNKL